MDETKPHDKLLPPRFELERQLNVGAFATTYLAHDRVLDRTVVIKTVKRDALWDLAARSRFEREAHAAAAVNHPNVVGVYDFGEYKGTLFLVLRHVEGVSLRSYLAQRGRLSANEAVRICGQLLAGLGAIHHAGLIHRDLKPENVIVGRDGLLRITDFGIAVARSDIRLTTHGEIWGTPAYMAPEQVLGEPISATADLYAVGVMLFEMLTGRLPFASDGDAVVAAYAHVSKPLPALWEIASDVDASPELEAVMRRALAKRPEERYLTAGAMASALETAFDGAATPIRIVAEPTRRSEQATAPMRGPDEVTAPIYGTKAQTTVASRMRPVAAFFPLRPRGLAVLIPLVIAAMVVAVFGGRGALGFWQSGGATPPATAAARATAGLTPTNRAEALVAATHSPTASTSVEPTTLSESIVYSAPSPTRRAASIQTATPTPTVTKPPLTATKKPSTQKAKRTATPKPIATPKRTATPNPKPTIASQPTIAAGVPVSATFAVTDWRGGFAGDQSWYGRPWLAVYGALSAYPRASIDFNLDAAPSGAETLAIDGLDDEWGGNVSIEIDVNDIAVYTGPSPWQSWDGVGHGENANWTTASLLIPPGTLRAGANQIVVSNTEQVANFGTGPYVLVSGAKILPGAP